MKIIENVLPPEQADWLETMLTSTDIQWSYIPDSSGTILEPGKGFPSFSHPIFNLNDRCEIQSRDLFSKFEPLLETWSVKAGKRPNDLNRIRMGMHVPAEHRGPHGPHTDQPAPHDVVLYYVNDSDGDTYFFDGEGEVIDRITPKKNTMVLFGGFKVHASSYPTKGQRITINLNYRK